ncbi:MAG: methionyl-tRNA formyltransferase [Flavobacteriales bacterium]
MRAFVIGSKNLSVNILNSLLNGGHEVLGVITRDNEPGMRVWLDKLGHQSLALEAQSHGIPVYEGWSVNSEKAIELLRGLNLDFIFSCFWGEIFKPNTLAIPKHGIYNLHTAYLPLNRGSRPIPWAIIEGESFSGITIHKMDSGVDSGPIVAQTKVNIELTDNAKSLYKKITQAGAELFEETLPSFADNSFKLIDQDSSNATYHPRGEPFGRQLNSFWDSDKRERFIRAFDFKPFAAHIETPGFYDNATPSVYWVLDNETTWLQLPKHPDNWRTQSIGNPEERKLIRQVVSKIGINKSIAFNQNLEYCYAVHDVLMNLGIKHISSSIYIVEEWNNAYPENQPFRHHNGLLEIPSVTISEFSDLNTLWQTGQQMKDEYQKDIFIPLVLDSKTDALSLSEELQKRNQPILSRQTIQRHYDFKYEN